jgi:uncharacterized OsmC-like protein
MTEQNLTEQPFHLPDVTRSDEMPSNLHGKIITMPVDAEILDLDGQKKVARYRHFEFFSDEPAYLGGTDEHPQPLTYLAAGVAFCLLTQLQRTARQLKKRLTAGRCHAELDIHSDGSIRKGTFTSSADAFRIHLEVESPEPPQVIAHIVRLAQQSCYAEAAVQTPLPIAHTYTLNGQTLEIPADPAQGA